MKPLLQDAFERAVTYLDAVPDRAVRPDRGAVANLAELSEPFPDDGQAPEAVLSEIDRVGGPATVASAGPRYFGFVTGGALPATVAASWLATAWDQNGFSAVSSPVAASVEAVALDWLRQIFGFPSSSGGAFVTGATMANFSALAAARHEVLQRVGWDVAADGLFQAPPITVIVGDEVHASLFKALRMLGLGDRRLTRRVPVDNQGRMRADALPAISGPTILCLQAGNVNSGACDPCAEIIPPAQAAGAWAHIDGAFGAWAKAAPARAGQARGLELADSLAVDAHKWLNVPYDSGIALVREPAALRAAMSINAAYLPEESTRDPFEYTPECSRRMRGLEIFTALRVLGRNGLADLVERCCRHATRLAEGLRDAGFCVLNEVELNQVLVSFGPPDVTQRVIAAVNEDGTCWCGGTVWQDQTAMRISVSSWATTEQDVEASLAAIVRIARRCRA